MGELQGAITTTSQDHLQPPCRPDDSCSKEEDSSIAVASAHQVSFQANSTCGKCCSGVVGELRGWVKQELIALGKLALPLILTLVLQETPLMVSMLFVGHITGRPLELDSAALSISFVNITGIAVAFGLATAADTLCSQTYGFKNYFRVGHIFQRGVLILIAWSLFTMCVWLNCESLLLLTQQVPCVARLSGSYVQIFFVGLPAYFVYVMLQRYLNSQGIVWLFILVGLVANILNPIFHAIFIFWAGLGLNGAAISLALTHICEPLLTVLYVWARKLHKKTWEGWSMEALRGWGEFLKLGVPGAAMMCIEWLSLEIAALVVGSIDEIQLVINSAVISFLITLFMPGFGISFAGTVRVGNELGAGRPLQAKRAAHINILVTCAIAMVGIVFLQAVKNDIGKLYTSDEIALRQIPKVLDVVTIMLIPNQLQTSLSGIIRGCGHQLFGAVVNFVAYYMVALPIGISLAFAAEMGALGMWLGLACGYFVQAIVFIIALALTNWEKESRKASQRGAGDSTKEKEEEKEVDGSSLPGSESVQELVLRESGLLSQEEDAEESVAKFGSDDNLVMISFNSCEDAQVEIADSTNLINSDCCEKNRKSWGKKLLPSKSNLKLLLSKGSVFVLGAMLVVAAGIASQYHPPDNIINGNFSECTMSNDTAELFSSYTHSVLTPTSTFPMSTSGHITTSYSQTDFPFPLTPTP